MPHGQISTPDDHLAASGMYNTRNGGISFMSSHLAQILTKHVWWGFFGFFRGAGTAAQPLWFFNIVMLKIARVNCIADNG